jgi:hypothetical protein
MFKPKFQGFEGAEDFTQVVLAGGFDSVFNIANEERIEKSCMGLDDELWGYIDDAEVLRK